MHMCKQKHSHTQYVCMHSLSFANTLSEEHVMNLQDDKEPEIYGSEEMEEEVKHMLMREDLDQVLEQPVFAGADDFLGLSDPKVLDTEPSPAILQAEAAEATFALPPEEEEFIWIERDR